MNLLRVLARCELLKEWSEEEGLVAESCEARPVHFLASPSLRLTFCS